jgi:hypothetical protein
MAVFANHMAEVRSSLSRSAKMAQQLTRYRNARTPLISAPRSRNIEINSTDHSTGAGRDIVSFHEINLRPPQRQDRLFALAGVKRNENE